MKRLAVLISVVALASFTFATPVLAAPPGNDDASTPTGIPSLPYVDSEDTSEATANLADPDCIGTGTNASVWYAFTTGGEPMNLLADTDGSDYGTQIVVVAGSPTGEIVGCGISVAGFSADPSTTYYIMVAACFNFGGVGPAAIGCDPSATGGSLIFNLDVAPPPPTLELTVDPSGHFNKHTGSATITGTFACTDASFVVVDVQLTQTVGRFRVSGFGEVFFDAPLCDGSAQPWSVEVLGASGLFKGGRAAAVAFGNACGAFECAFDEVSQKVMLR